MAPCLILYGCREEAKKHRRKERGENGAKQNQTDGAMARGGGESPLQAISSGFWKMLSVHLRETIWAGRKRDSRKRERK